MNSPFYQPSRQSFGSSQNMQQPQGGFGGGQSVYAMSPQSGFGMSQGPMTFGGGSLFGGSFGGGQGYGGGFQPQFGGGQGFGGFGGGQGFQPQFGGGQGYGGGFQPQFGGGQGYGGGFNPFQGGQGYGGGMQQGYNPMFGGIGGLGFNPQMGQQFGMPMQGGFNPYQQQQQQYNPYQQQQQQYNPYQQQFNPYQQPRVSDTYEPSFPQQMPEYFTTMPVDEDKYAPSSPFTGPQMNAQNILEMAVGKTPKDMQYDLNKDGKITSADALAYHRQYGQQAAAPAPAPAPSNASGSQFTQLMQTNGTELIRPPAQQTPVQPTNLQSLQPNFEDQQRQFQMLQQQRQQQSMFGGIGGLGFNPMMGRNFGMPMDMRNRGAPELEMLRQQQRMYGGGQDTQPTQRQDTSIDAFKNSQAYKDYANTPRMSTQDMGHKSKYGFGTGSSSYLSGLDSAYENWAKQQGGTLPADQSANAVLQGNDPARLWGGY